MSNLNHANDKLKAPRCDSCDNSNQFSNKMHYLKGLSRLLESAYEGFNLADNYSNAAIDETLRLEGQAQCNFYISLFDKTLLELGCFLDGIINHSNTNIGGK